MKSIFVSLALILMLTSKQVWSSDLYGVGVDEVAVETETEKEPSSHYIEEDGFKAKNVIGGILCATGVAVFIGSRGAKSGEYESDAYDEGTLIGGVLVATGITLLLVGNDKKSVSFNLQNGRPSLALNYNF